MNKKDGNGFKNITETSLMTHSINAYLNVSVKNDDSSEIQFIIWAMNNL